MIDSNSYGSVAGVAAYVRRLTNAAGTFSDGNASGLTTALAGANNDLTYTARQIAADGDAITIAYVNPGIPASLSVSVSGRAISVTLAHDGLTVTSTAAQVAAAIAAKPAADALVSVANAPGSDGTGIVTAMSAANLSGGVSATQPTLTEVEAFIDQSSDILNGWLYATGYAVPAVAADAVSALARFANLGAAGLAELSQRAGGYNADDENQRENKFLKMFDDAQAYIQSGVLSGLGAVTRPDTAPPPLAGFRVGGRTRTGQAVRPMFTRTMAGWNPVAETGPREPGYTDS